MINLQLKQYEVSNSYFNLPSSSSFSQVLTADLYYLSGYHLVLMLNYYLKLNLLGDVLFSYWKIRKPTLQVFCWDWNISSTEGFEKKTRCLLQPRNIWKSSLFRLSLTPGEGGFLTRLHRSAGKPDPSPWLIDCSSHQSCRRSWTSPQTLDHIWNMSRAPIYKY